MARAFNARVRLREFNPGDLVLRKVLHVSPDSRGKFAYKYDGPFVVKETFSGGAVILNDMDGTENALPVNADAIKKYYPWPLMLYLNCRTSCPFSFITSFSFIRDYPHSRHSLHHETFSREKEE
ncbi:hypothetical protein CRG98_016573 [Punica granatum]|uniref:Uncharacterized protein n=1 Tax=Punica granatum TaxID=22663 RepID=A0A2I0K3C3_PUNGR|nr:hypothetical protein CRG98_016573 [Punica granatum]